MKYDLKWRTGSGRKRGWDFLAIFYESVKDVKYVKYFRQTLIADTLAVDM